jgi:ribosomal protein L19
VIVHRHSHVRRAKLYHLRERTGKEARLKQKFTS